MVEPLHYSLKSREYLPEDVQQDKWNSNESTHNNEHVQRGH